MPAPQQRGRFIPDLGAMVKYDFDKVIDRGPGSGTFSFKWQGYEGRFPGFDIDVPNALSMWVADMDFETIPEVKEAIIQRAEHGIFGYTSEDSNDAFRDAAMRWFARRYGWTNCRREWMLFSPGVVPAINNAVQAFTDEGDGVIIQSPVYYPFEAAVANTRRMVRNNQLIERDGRYEMDYDQLEALAVDPAAKMIVLSSPHNPVGRVWSREELERAFEICARNDVLVFCDEIHADLIMPGQSMFAAGILEKHHDRLILAHAASKSFNLAGLTTSLITVPNPELRGRLAKKMSENRLPQGNVFGPIAGAAAYDNGDDYIDELVRYIHGNVCFAQEWLAEHLPKAKIVPLEGTYLVWIDFRGIGLPEEELYHLVIEKAKVIGDLGRWFGPGGEGFMRFNFACPRKRIEEFLVRLTAQLADK